MNQQTISRTAGPEIFIAAPIKTSERMQSLDVLRGFSLIGILLVNMQVFAMIFATLQNPTTYGDLTGLNYVVAFITYALAQQKFMTLFAILFGAGIYLMAKNIEDKGINPVIINFQRMMWLLLIGLIHAYCIWYGDILVSYAACGLLAYFARKSSPKRLFISGLIILGIGSLIFVLMDLTFQYWPQELVSEALAGWRPDTEAIAREVAIHRGGWMEQMELRVPKAAEFQTVLLLFFTFWRAFGLMLVGMSLFKWDILTGKAEKRTYTKMIGVGFIIGIPMVLAGWFSSFSHDWDFDYAMFKGFQFNYWGSLFISAAYIGAVILMTRSKSSFVSRINRLLSAMGRMAFTNYLVQSILCTLIFYGHGLGLFGKLDRTVQFLLVIMIIALQAWYSSFWLKYYRFGPLEWIWRTLTYKKKQTMKLIS
jgi:uncharacterized protein